MKCILSTEINNCPFCNKGNMICNNEKSCAFQEKEVVQEKEKYVREERWYEKYYRRK